MVTYISYLNISCQSLFQAKTRLYNVSGKLVMKQRVWGAGWQNNVRLGETFEHMSVCVCVCVCVHQLHIELASVVVVFTAEGMCLLLSPDTFAGGLEVLLQIEAPDKSY